MKLCWNMLQVTISSTFYARIWHPYFGAKKLQSQMKVEKSCSICFRTKKRLHKMLMKLTPVVNFINIFCAHFSYESPFKAKTLLEKRLSYEKHMHKTLIKLTPGRCLSRWFQRRKRSASKNRRRKSWLGESTFTCLGPIHTRDKKHAIFRNTRDFLEIHAIFIKTHILLFKKTQVLHCIFSNIVNFSFKNACISIKNCVYF